MNKRLPDNDIPEAIPALVFTNDKVNLEVDDAPILTLPLKKLKEAVRKAAKEKPLTTEQIQDINELFV